jgi:prepilin-type N-terminal cleavage/methylation domain-containing protein
MFKKVKDNSGFTIIEMAMVLIMLGILTQMSWNFLADMRHRSSDVVAVADGRNLMTVVRANFINLDSVNYTHDPNQGSEIGTRDRDNNARAAVFTLSPGVKARIEAGSESGGVHQGSFEAWLFHENGTGREFFFYANEEEEIYSLPTY